MKKMLRLSIEIVKDFFGEVIWFLSGSLYPVAVLMEILLPYLTLFIGACCYEKRGMFAVGGEIFLPLVAFLGIDFIKRYANKIGKGNDMPIPDERFTKVDNDGEVSVDTDRLQELILYLGNLEDWIDRKGLR